MTISSTNRKAGPYVGNGSSTVFPFSFKIFSASDLYVTRTNALGVATTLTKDVDFIPTLNANQDASPGGSIALTAALAVGYTLDITSDISPTQLLDLTNQGGFYPQVITKALDKITILIQQLITNGITSGSIGGIVTSARNLVGGFGLFFGKVGDELQFKSLEPGTNVSIVDTGNTLRISATGEGGGTWDGFANIVDFGAVADFVPAAGSTGTGTNSDVAIAAAAGTGKPLWIPAGDFLVTDASRNTLNAVSSSGPGTIWVSTNVGITKMGKMLAIGTNRSHEMQSVGGIKLGGESGDGFRWYMGHHNWSQIQPTKYGAPTQFQLYPSVVCGLATTTSPNVLKAVHGSFDASRMTVGDHIGFGNEVFKIASFISPTQITVTKFDGSSPSFSTNTTQRTFYHAYEIAQGTCNVNGTTVTYLSGEQYPFGVSQDHMYAIINGTKYNVASGPESVGANFLTLASYAGTLSNATIEFRRCWGYWAYVTLLRLQGLGGGIETNCGLYLNIRNEAVLFNSGYGSTYYGDMRVNANKIYLGCGDGTGGTESMEIGSDYNSLGGLYGSESVRVHKIPGGTANRIDIIGGASSFAPAITMRSSTEANQSLGFDLQGNGTFRFTAGTFARTVSEIYAPASTTAWPTMSAGVGAASFSVNGAASNIDIVTAPKGLSGRNLQKKIPVCMLSRVGAFSFPSGAGTTVDWDTEIADVHNMHAAGSPIVVAPVAGLYRINASAQISGVSDANGVNITGIYLLKNGAAVKASPFTRHRGPNASAYTCGSQFIGLVELTASDTVAIQVYYAGGGTAASLDTSFSFTYFEVELVTAY